MLATKIFPETFRNFQKMIARNQIIQNQLLARSRNPFLQYHVADLYSMTNLISLQLSDLQNNQVIDLLQSFNSVQRRIENNLCKNIHTDIDYNQNRQLFTLKYLFQYEKRLPLLQTIKEVRYMNELQLNRDLQQVRQVNEKQQLSVLIKIRNCKQQKLDHPSMRQTLYFHELKDLDKYVKYQFLPKTPIFIQDMNRKKLEMKLLDQKNPYGFPLKAPPLIFTVQLAKKIYFTIKSTYEETNVVEVGSLKRVETKDRKNILQRFKISGMRVPRTLHKILYEEVFTNLLLMDDAQILRFHKLAYVGGRIQKLNLLMNVHETMCLQSQKLFDRKMSLIA